MAMIIGIVLRLSVTDALAREDIARAQTETLRLMSGFPLVVSFGGVNGDHWGIVSQGRDGS